jgi:hypothetical protein
MKVSKEDIIDINNTIWMEHIRRHIESMVHDWEWLCKHHPMVARELQDYKADKYMNTGEEE